MTARTPEAIAARLAAVAAIPITEGGYSSSKYYGTPIDIGASGGKCHIWHCDEQRGQQIKPSAEEIGDMTPEEWAEYCSDSHWQSQGDYDMGVFLVNAQRDIQALLALLGTQVELEPEPSL